MRALLAIALVATPAAADWKITKTVKAGSMPWGVIATARDVFVAHVGYRGRDNVWRYRDLEVVAKSKFAGHAVEIALSPDGKTIYAGNSRKDTVSVIDVETKTAKTIVVGDGPRGLDLANGKLYVASLRASTVSVIDPSTLAVTKTITGCRGAAHTAVSADGKRVFVTCYGARHVQVIDTSTDEAVRLVEVGRGPNPIAVTATEALVANEFDDTLSAIDLAAWTVTTTKLPIDRPVGVFVHGKRAYVTGRGSTKLVVLER